MNFRTLSKSDTFHVVNLGSLLLSWAVTGYFFSGPLQARSEALLGSLLLTPLKLVNELLLLTGLAPMNHPVMIFIFLWFCYLITTRKFSVLLMVTDHAADDLKKWYYSRSGN